MKRDREKVSIVFLPERLEFPHLDSANSEGLVAIGGDLSPERLLLAYKNGIFPWFNEGSPILWWSPDPRMILFPGKVHISKSMRKVMASDRFALTKNTSFEAIVDQCAIIRRKGQTGTWIGTKMKSAYLELHAIGVAKSYEVWEGDELVGGLYGVDLGHIFCGESMFSTVSNASKFAFIQLAQDLRQKNYLLIDCQVYNQHLESLGAEEIPREDFMRILEGCPPLTPPKEGNYS